MKTLKLFAVCCGMLLAGIVSTTKSTAQSVDPGGFSTGVACVGDEGICGTVLKDDVLYIFTGEIQTFP